MPHQVVEFDGIPQRPAEHRPLAGDGRVGGGLPVEPEGQQIKRSPYERRLRELRERETIRPEPCVDPDLLLRHRISVRRVERPLVEECAGSSPETAHHDQSTSAPESQSQVPRRCSSGAGATLGPTSCPRTPWRARTTSPSLTASSCAQAGRSPHRTRIPCRAAEISEDRKDSASFLVVWVLARSLFATSHRTMYLL